MGCPPVHGDNPRALASGLSYVQSDNPWYNYYIGCFNIQVFLVKANYTVIIVTIHFIQLCFTAYMGCWKNGYRAFQGPGTSSNTQSYYNALVW